MELLYKILSFILNCITWNENKIKEADKKASEKNEKFIEKSDADAATSLTDYFNK